MIFDFERLVAAGKHAMHVAVVEAVEAAFRCGESSTVVARGEELARIVGPSRRGNYVLAARDSIRGTGTIRKFLRDGDIIVTSHSTPVAVIVSVEEYERLTGRRPQTEEQ